VTPIIIIISTKSFFWFCCNSKTNYCRYCMASSPNICIIIFRIFWTFLSYLFKLIFSFQLFNHNTNTYVANKIQRSFQLENIYVIYYTTITYIKHKIKIHGHCLVFVKLKLEKHFISVFNSTLESEWFYFVFKSKILKYTST